MNMNVFEQRFNDEFQKELESRPFPSEMLDSNWFYHAREALSMSSPMALGLSGRQFARLVDTLEVEICSGIPELTLYDFAILNNCIERTSQKDLDVPMAAYCYLMTTTSSLADQWNETVKPLREELEKKLATEFAEANKGLGRPAGYKPVKAEA